MPTFYSVSTVTRKLRDELGVEVPPRSISDLFYARELDDCRCPVIGGRRLIDADYVPEIVRVLRRKGWIGLPQEAAQ